MRSFIAITTGFATVALAAVYASAGMWVWVSAILLLGALWLLQSWRGQRWMPTLGLLSFTTAALMGAFFNLPSFWLLTGLVAALIAWDLDHFAAVLDDVSVIRNETSLKRHHFRRLGIVSGLGWLLGVAALNVRFTFGFSVTIVLGVGLVAAMSGAIRYIRREQP